MSSGSNGLRWGAISQQAGRVFSHGVLSKPPANTRPPSSPKFIRAHNILWHAPHSSRIRPSIVGSASHATHPVLDGSIHHVTVTQACESALAPWRDPFWLKRGVILDTAHRRKVVKTDASNKGWGALCEGKPTFACGPKRSRGCKPTAYKC